MKLTKTLWLAGLALFAASCSNDDMVDAPRSGNAISFDGIAVKNASRAYTELSNSTLTDFNVWAYYGTDNATDVFTGAKIVNSGGAWANAVTSEEQEWQQGETYNFYAVAPAVENPNFTKNGTAYYYENDGETDICSAKNTGIVAQAIGANQAVSLSFKHMLSRVRFQIENKSTDYTIKGSVKITNAVKHANLNCDALSWYDQGDNLELTFSFEDIAAVDNGVTTTGTSTKNFLIPSDRTYWIIYDLTLVDGSNNETALDVNPIQLQLNNELGKSYTISASITGPQIVSNTIAFDPQIATADDWSEDWTNNSVTTIEDSNFDLLQLTAKAVWKEDNITWDNNAKTITVDMGQEQKTETEEEKDANGNVTSSTKYYWWVSDTDPSDTKKTTSDQPETGYSALMQDAWGNAAIGWFDENAIDLSDYSKLVLELEEASTAEIELVLSIGGFWGANEKVILTTDQQNASTLKAEIDFTNLTNTDVDLTKVNMIFIRSGWVHQQTIKIKSLYLEK